MIRHLVVNWVLLFSVQYAGVQAQTATWKFPTAGDAVQANIVDTVLLDWTSSFATTVLKMWCPNLGGYAIVSNETVDSTGPFKYILQIYKPTETGFPLLCHAELDDGFNGAGTNSPAGILFSSDLAQAAKTVSLSQPASTVTVALPASQSSTSTLTSVPPSSSTPTSTSAPPTSITNSNASPASTTSSTTTSSISQSTTSVPITSQPTTLSTRTSESSSGATIVSQTSASASSSASPFASSSPHNTGAIVGGVLGGAALTSFIILALLFLRKYRGGQEPSSPTTTDPSRRGFFHLDTYDKPGPKAGTIGVFEKQNDVGAHETDASGVLPRGQPFGQLDDVNGGTAWKTAVPRGESWVGGNQDHARGPVELPSGSNEFSAPRY